MFKQVLAILALCALTSAQTTTTKQTSPTTKPTTTTVPQLKAVDDVASLKKSINTYFDQSYELLKSLGLASGQSQTDEYTSDFCVNKWKTYQVKETFNLSTALKDFYNVYTFFYPHSVFAIKDDNLFFFVEKNSGNGVDLKTYNFRTKVLGTNLVTLTLDAYQYVTSKGVSVDRNGNIYAALVTGNGYKLQLFKFDSKAPFSLMKSVNHTMPSYTTFESITYDINTNQFYMMPSLGSLMIFDEFLAINRSTTFAFHFSLYFHNGRQLLNADREYIRKFNPADFSMRSTKVKPSFTYFNGLKLNNECMFVAYFDYSYSNTLNLTMLHASGNEAYNVLVPLKYPANYDTSLYVTLDSKIYHISVDKSVNAVLLTKLDYAI